MLKIDVRVVLSLENGRCDAIIRHTHTHIHISPKQHNEMVVFHYVSLFVRLFFRSLLLSHEHSARCNRIHNKLWCALWMWVSRDRRHEKKIGGQRKGARETGNIIEIMRIVWCWMHYFCLLRACNLRYVKQRWISFFCSFFRSCSTLSTFPILFQFLPYENGGFFDSFNWAKPAILTFCDVCIQIFCPFSTPYGWLLWSGESMIVPECCASNNNKQKIHTTRHPCYTLTVLKDVQLVASFSVRLECTVHLRTYL